MDSPLNPTKTKGLMALPRNRIRRPPPQGGGRRGRQNKLNTIRKKRGGQNNSRRVAHGVVDVAF